MLKNDRKVRLVVKKYDNFKQIPTFKGNQITMTDNVYKC